MYLSTLWLDKDVINMTVKKWDNNFETFHHLTLYGQFSNCLTQAGQKVIKMLLQLLFISTLIFIALFSWLFKNVQRAGQQCSVHSPLKINVFLFIPSFVTYSTFHFIEATFITFTWLTQLFMSSESLIKSYY